MFDGLPEWGSNISLRRVVITAVLFGFCSGLSAGTMLVAAVRLHTSGLDLAGMLVDTLLAAGLAIKFFSLTMSRVREQRLAMTM